jgi:hypothetical protein
MLQVHGLRKAALFVSWLQNTKVNNPIELSLHLNHLSELPHELACLMNLKILDLSYNNFRPAETNCIWDLIHQQYCFD